MNDNAKITSLTDEDFDIQVAAGTVLVDFWASWCMPCRLQGPILDRVAASVKPGGVRIYKLNVDEQPRTPSRFQINSIPTLLLFLDGQVVRRMIGLQDEKSLMAALGA